MKYLVSAIFRNCPTRLPFGPFLTPGEAEECIKNLSSRPDVMSAIIIQDQSPTMLERIVEQYSQPN